MKTEQNGGVRTNRFAMGGGDLPLYLLSALGSVPVHMAPALVVWNASDQSVSGPEVISSVLFGTFLAACIMPQRILADRRTIVWACGAYLVFLGATTIAHGPMEIITWLLIGVCSGMFVQLGYLTAARSADPSAGFAFRIMSTLVLAGCTLLAGISLPAPPAVAFKLPLAILAVGLLVWFIARPRTVVLPTSEPNGQVGPSTPGAAGFAAIALLFAFCVALTAYFAFLSELTSGDESGPRQMIRSLAIAKLLSAGLLFALLRARSSYITRNVTAPLLFALLCLMLDDVLIATAGTAAFIALETLGTFTISALSALTVSSLGRQNAALLLPVTLLGFSVGPLVGAAMIDLGGFLTIRLSLLAVVAILLGGSLVSLYRSRDRAPTN